MYKCLLKKIINIKVYGHLGIMQKNTSSYMLKALQDETVIKLRRIVESSHGLDDFSNNVNIERIPSENNCCVDSNEVYPNLFISDGEAAMNKDYLKATGITHVLNAAEGEVKTSTEYYSDVGIKYLGLQLMDSRDTPIHRYFQETADFIEEGIKSGGKVLVHCVMGISRSSTCAIAYLMIKKHMNVEDAVQQIKIHRRCIGPNYGFLIQLAALDRQLQSNS